MVKVKLTYCHSIKSQWELALTITCTVGVVVMHNKETTYPVGKKNYIKHITPKKSAIFTDDFIS